MNWEKQLQASSDGIQYEEGRAHQQRLHVVADARIIQEELLSDTTVQPAGDAWRCCCHHLLKVLYAVHPPKERQLHTPMPPQPIRQFVCGLPCS